MNSFGKLLRVSIYGESHGPEVGLVIDGIPAGIKINHTHMLEYINRRKPYGMGATSRHEDDIPNFKSGIIDGITTGTPILVSFENTNYKSEDYDIISNIPRPNHADFVASQKYFGHQDIRGGGHFSGRLTLGIVLAGFLAQEIIKNCKITANVVKVGGKKNYTDILNQAIQEKDSLGAEIKCSVTGLPVGLGQPFFDSVESLLAHAIFSIPGIKAISFGTEKEADKSSGSQYNDVIINSQGKTKTNNSGGLVGGITNGNALEFTVKVKPTASIGSIQKSYNFVQGKIVAFAIEGRHDACFGLRVPVIIEAMTALVLADLYLIRMAEEKEYESRKNKK